MAFDGPTHVYVTQRGLEILDDVFGGEISKFFTEEDRRIILTYCVKPDEDEIEGAYKYHFFNPVTELNFMGEVTSARTKCDDHYNRAVHYMKLHYQAIANGDLDRAKKHRGKAMEELGRSSHFLQDLNTPVHTNNQTLLDTGFNLLSHVRFENTCKSVQERVRPSMRGAAVRYFVTNNVKTIATCFALLSDDNLYGYHEGFLSKEQAAENSVKNAQTSSAGLYYKFWFDVERIKT